MLPEPTGDGGGPLSGGGGGEAGSRPRFALLAFLGVGAGLTVAVVGAVLVMEARWRAGFSQGGGGAPLRTECVGPRDATIGLIYLHGIDPPDASLQEQSNRRAIARLADQQHLRIALARSPDSCPREPTKRCWPNGSAAVVKSTLQRLLADTAQCFGGQAPQGLIGFSNGGFFAAKVAQFCLMPGTTGIVAIGAAGSWQPSDPSDLSACPRLVAMIGRQDISRRWAIDYVHHLQNRRARVQLKEYQGGHVLPPDELGQVVAQLFPAAPFPQ